MTRIVLASTSPFRKKLLERLKLNFEVCNPDVDETKGLEESPSNLVQRLAKLKAQAVAIKYPDAIIIGSDQVAACNGQILGKPGNFKNAKQQLTQLSGNLVTFHTGICVINTTTQISQCEEVKFFVEFRELSEEMIINYLNKEPAYNCAGSFKSEALGIALTRRMSGDDPTSLVGLPLIQLCRMLENTGTNIL